VVTITKPMRYKIDEELVHRLVKQGAFSLLSDGRDSTHGKAHIKGFYLRDHPGMHVGESRRNAMNLAIGGAAGMVIVAAAFFAHRTFRRNGYTVVAEEVSEPFEIA